MVDYYDIDDILATGEKVPCIFNISVPGLGYLEGNPGKPINEGTKVELPLWLAEQLAHLDAPDGTPFILLLEPESLNVKVRNAIRTDPVALDVHSILPNYYKMAEKYCSFFSDEELSEIIKQMIKERSLEIYSYANNSSKQMNSRFMLSLDEFEKRLFKLASESNRQMKNWLKE